MTDRLGILPHSPLIFTLASIRFAAWPLMAKKIDEIQDSLRETVPILQRIEVRQVASNGQVSSTDDGAPTSAWMLLSSDRSFGFQFTQDQVIFFSRKYIRYSDFSTIFAKGLQVLFDQMKFIDVTNLGVRYIDHVHPREGELLDEYVHKPLLQPKFRDLDNNGGMAAWIYQTKDANLRIRTNSQAGSLKFPDDLVSLLIMSHDPTNQLQLDALQENQMILDIDAFAVNPSPLRMSLKEIVTRLEILHGQANKFFRSVDVCTNHAFNVWKETRI